ncbi:MAG TPA: FKBP-type peptidyl-prolyl cis-trans isomerase [Gemmatimonadaceae bacterium]
MKSIFRFGAAALIAGTTACLASDDITGDAIPIEKTNFASALGVDLAASTKTARGAYYRDITVGTGAAVASGDSVFVRYTLWLSNGTLIQTNTAEPQPLPFKIGVGDVIAGFDETLVGAKVGSVRQLIIPPALGYGPYDNGPIPGNSVLVFNVQVVSKK